MSFDFSTFIMDSRVWLWIAVSLLVMLYSYAFVAKTFFSREKLIQIWDWPKEVPLRLIRFIGLCEGAAVVGLVLPTLNDILPWLTFVDAVCLTVLQILAMRLHLKRKDNFAHKNAFIMMLSALVAWGFRHTLGF